MRLTENPLSRFRLSSLLLLVAPAPNSADGFSWHSLRGSSADQKDRTDAPNVLLRKLAWLSWYIWVNPKP